MSNSATQLAAHADHGSVAVGRVDRLYGITVSQFPEQRAPRQTPEECLANVRAAALDEVRRRVRQQWIKDVLHRSLEHTNEVELNLAKQPGAVQPPISNRRQSWTKPERLASGTRLVELYDGLAFRRLVILGKPGAGKSTELLRLAEALLDRADADADQPVPVVLQMSTWNQPGDAADAAMTWLTGQIVERYRAPSDDDVASWLAQDRLALLFDGLDEITDPDRQRRCITALSALLATPEVRVGTVICCRTEEYRRIDRPLEFDLAITVLPLTRDQVNSYFAAAGDALKPMLCAVDADPDLAQNLDTPLTLQVTALTYEGQAPQASLLTGDSDRHLAHLWDRYLEVMLCRDRDPYIDPVTGRSVFSRRDTYRHVVELARLMVQRNRVEISLDWFGTDWLPERDACRRLTAAGPRHALLALLGAQRTGRLLTGLVIGLAIALPIGLGYGLANGHIRGLVNGLLYSLIGGLIYGLTYGLAPAKIGGSAGRRSWLAVSYALGGLCLGLSYGLALKTTAELFPGSRLQLTAGLPQALVSGLIDGLVGGLSTRLILGRVSAENAGATWRWSRPAAGYGLLCGLCSGAAYGFVYGAGSGQLPGAQGALTAGLLSSLALGAVNGWQPDLSHPSTTPGQALRQTLRTNARRISVSLLIGVALIAATLAAIQVLFFPAQPERLASLVVAVTKTALSSLALGVTCKGMLPWIDHLLTRRVAAWTNLLPRDLTAFLDHCDERVLLRRSGGYYLFVHLTLRDHLAASDPQNPPFPLSAEPPCPS